MKSSGLIKGLGRFGVLLVLLSLATPSFAVEGFFTVGQQDGRWWFFTPEGEKLFSTGINLVNPGGHYCPPLGTSPYEDNILARYGSREAWAEVTLQRLRDWHFNTLGAWSATELFTGEMYTTPILYMSGADWLTGYVPDYFDQEFYDRVEDIASGLAASADDPNLIGYFFDNEMRWAMDHRRLADLFADYLALPPDAPGKVELQNWLHDRYNGELHSFNAVYGTHLDRWGDLQKVFGLGPFHLADDRIGTDRRAWTFYVADHFFATCTEAIRTYDPNHLILGIRFVSWLTPVEVVLAAAPYLDVISVNHYLVWEPIAWLHDSLYDTVGFVSTADMLAAYHELTDKPVLISEFSMRGLDAVPPSTWPPPYFFKTAFTQEQRTAWVEQYTDACVESTYCVGYHWFDYMDEPVLGRFDGEDSNFGLVDEQDDPYQLLIDMFAAQNIRVYDWPHP